MSIDILPSEILLHIFDYVLGDDVLVNKLNKIYIIGKISSGFYDIIMLHPLMILVRDYKNSKANVNSTRVLNMYTSGRLLSKIRALIEVRIADKISMYNNKRESTPIVDRQLSLLDKSGRFGYKISICKGHLRVIIAPNITIAFDCWFWMIKNKIDCSLRVKTKLLLCQIRSMRAGDFEVRHKYNILKKDDYDLSELPQKTIYDNNYINTLFIFASNFDLLCKRVVKLMDQ